MSTFSEKPGSRGRPPGRTDAGEQTRAHLYHTAVRLFGEVGYEASSLRDIAQAAGVSVGLLYRYFPSKGALVMALYTELSGDFARRAAALPAGRWWGRTLDGIDLSLATLRPHRAALRGAVHTMLIDEDVGLFSPGGAPARAQVRGVFLRATAEASDAPAGGLSAVVGRLNDVLHLVVVLAWLLDRSPSQRGTAGLLEVFRGLGPLVTALMWLPGVGARMERIDAVVGEILTGEAS